MTHPRDESAARYLEARADKLKPKSRHVARTLRAAASDLRAGLHVEGDEK